MFFEQKLNIPLQTKIAIHFLYAINSILYGLNKGHITLLRLAEEHVPSGINQHGWLENRHVQYVHIFPVTVGKPHLQFVHFPSS